LVRLIAWGLGTIWWLGFTTWFFGAGLGDRVIEYTGGGCGVVLPHTFGVDINTLSIDLAGEGGGSKGNPISAGIDQILIPLPSRFCNLHLPLNAQTHPTLFANIPSSPQLTQALRPRWHKGFDISGHTFLLTLSALLLVRELYPSWRMLWGRSHRAGAGVGRAGGWSGLVYLGVTIGGTALIGLWAWMLGMTSVWFHNPPEKLSGLGELT
jgi:hypothetical protein